MSDIPRSYIGDDMSHVTHNCVVKEEDGFFLVRENDWTFWDDPSVYEIEVDRIGTAEKLLGCVAHMSDKTWFSSEHARQLILAADKHHGDRLISWNW